MGVPWVPEKLFRVNIYDVELLHTGDEQPTEFQEAIQSCSGEPLADREKNISGKYRRLDSHDQRNGVFLLNFVTFEYAGPGRVRRTQPTRPIPMAADESFAPETAMLYHPVSNLAFVESSQGSMGPGAITGYFEEFANRGSTYALHPRTDQNAAVRARRYQTIRNLEMRISVGPATDQDRAAGIGPLRGFGANYGAEYIDVELKPQRARGRTLTLGRVQEFIALFTGGNRNMPQIVQLRVTGREQDDDPLEVIDLIQHREKRQIMLQIDGNTRKVPHSTRWDALVNAHRVFTRL